MRDGWETVRVSDVATVVGGGTPKSGVETYWGGDVPWLTPKDLSKKPARYTSSGERSITEEGLKASGARLLPPGSVLLTSRAPVGYVTVASAPLATNQGFKSLVLKDDQVPEFWYYLLGHSTDFLRAHSGGSTFAELSGSALKTLEFTIPPVLQQRRIVDLIGAVDEAIEAARDHMAALDELLLAAQDDIPYAPTSKLGDILQGIDSGTSAQAENCPYSATDKRILKVSAVRPARFYPDESKVVGQIALPEKGAVREGDLLMTRSNTPDRVGYVCVARDVAQHTYMPDLIWRLRVDESKVSTKYLEHALSSQRLRRAITAIGTGTSQSMRKINKRGVAGIQVPMPIASEQAGYVERAESIIRVLRDAQSVRDVLRTLRASLLSALLSGEHRIPEPYDELVGA